jgi:hypothetical protein
MIVPRSGVTEPGHMPLGPRAGELLEIRVHQHGGKVTCDYYAYAATESQQYQRPSLHRRVIITSQEKLNRAQMVEVAARMVSYVRTSQRGNSAVPRGLPWWEVGVTAQPVPPGGGEGGEKAEQLAIMHPSGDVIKDDPDLPSAIRSPRQGTARAKRGPISSVD